MCSGGGFGQQAAAAKAQVSQIIRWVSHNSAVVAVAAGAVLVMYGFYRISVRLMKFFLNVSDKQVFNMGCTCGFFAALGIAGAVVGSYRYLNISARAVKRAAVAELRKHQHVEEALGGYWRQGRFRGYASESVHEAVYGTERRQRASYWELPAQRMQMIFHLKGAKRDGMVSLEAYKKYGAIRFEMLSLDVAGTKEHIFLEGGDDHELFGELLEMFQTAKDAQSLKNASRKASGGA